MGVGRSVSRISGLEGGLRDLGLREPGVFGGRRHRSGTRTTTRQTTNDDNDDDDERVSDPKGDARVLVSTCLHFSRPFPFA